MNTKDIEQFSNFPDFSNHDEEKPFFSQKKEENKEKNNLYLVFLVAVVSSIFGAIAGGFLSIYFYFNFDNYLALSSIDFPLIFEERIKEKEKTTIDDYQFLATQERAVIEAVKSVSPAVVSIVISKDVPIIEQYFYNPFEDFERFFGPVPQFQIPQYREKGTEKREIGGGTGFIVSSDGLILTNKHVVADTQAEYSVFMNDGRKFSAKIIARHPIQDIAILRIEQDKKVSDGETSFEPFSVLELGDSEKLEIGQTVIAIGNALGEFRNTVSVGVISGLGRSITASGEGYVEILEDVIQTDAAINKGNSGGPLLNLKGQVIGINTAMAVDAQSIGFAIPINKAKKSIEQVRKLGKISIPFLGVRYILINEQIQKENNLSVNYGAWILKGDREEPAITKGSAAEKVGLQENDIILEFGGEKITQENSLAKIIMEYSPGDKVLLKILRDSKEITIDVVLGERE